MPAPLTSSELTQQNQQKTIYADLYNQQQLFDAGIISRIKVTGGSAGGSLSNSQVIASSTTGGVKLNNTNNPAISSTELTKITTKVTEIKAAATKTTTVVVNTIPVGTGYSVLVYDSANRVYLADSNLTTFTLVSETASTVTNTIFGCTDGLVRFVSGTTWLSRVSNILYKSIDNGLTWTRINSGTNWPNNIVFIYSADNSATTIYVGTYAYLYRTTNGGTTWTQLKYFSPDGSSIVFCVQGNNIVSIGIYNNTTNGNGGVWSSINGGTTFNKTNLGFTSGTFYGIDVIYYNNKFCSFMDDGTSTYKCESSDGVTWTKTAVATPYFFVRGTVRDPVSGIIVIAVTNNGTGCAIVYSIDDGYTWTAGTGSVVGKSAGNTSMSRLSYCANVLHYTGSMFILRTYNGSMHTSPDGKVWSTATLSPAGNTLSGFGIAYNDSTNQVR
jgi:hypothetical protein